MVAATAAEFTPERRAGWRIMPFGDAIEWDAIDEHVSIRGLLLGRQAPGAKAPPNDEAP